MIWRQISLHYRTEKPNYWTDILIIFLFGTTPPPPQPNWAMAPTFTRFLDHTQRRTTVGRTPLDEWSARCRDLYLTKHNTHDRHLWTPVGFEPTVSAGERPQTHALDRATTGTGSDILIVIKCLITCNYTEPILSHILFLLKNISVCVNQRSKQS